MEDIIFTTIVLLLGFGIQVGLQRGNLERFEQQGFGRGYLAHLAAGWALYAVYVFYYEDGDMFAYYRFAQPVVSALGSELDRFAPEVLLLFFQRETHLPLEAFTEGATASMQAVTIVLLFLLGNSFLAVVTLISTGSYLTKLTIYRALKPEFAPDQHRLVLNSIMFSPSGVVWSCAVLKEPVAVVFMAPIFLGLRWVLDGRRLWVAIPLMILGTIGVALVKPYVLLALTVAMTVWVVWARVLKGGSALAKPVYLVTAALVGAFGLTVASAVFPSLAAGSVSDSMAKQRRASATIEGDSNFYIEDQDVDYGREAPASFGSQLTLAPIALGTALFRPFLFESRKIMQFANSLEITWMTYLLFQCLWRTRPRSMLRRVMDSPALMFCVVFTLLLAFGTGLSSANLGALSRYRAPMMPFYLLALLLLRENRVSSSSPTGDRVLVPVPQEAPASLPA